MSILNYLLNSLFNSNANSQQQRAGSKHRGQINPGQRIAVKHRGHLRYYRINKYGEVLEEK